MTDEFGAIGDFRHIDLDLQLKVREAVAHDAGQREPFEIKRRLRLRRRLVDLSFKP